MPNLRSDLGQMRAAAVDAITILGDATLPELERNREKQAALCYLIIIAGESAARIRQRQEHRNYPGLDWDGLIGMRHVLVHQHFDTDLSEVIEAITEDHPVLIAAIDAILQDLP